MISPTYIMSKKSCIVTYYIKSDNTSWTYSIVWEKLELKLKGKIKKRERQEENRNLSWLYTICPGSSYPFYIVSYYIKWVTPSWTHSSHQIATPGAEGLC